MKETHKWQYVRCGKKGCKSCPHGPYLYAYWWEGGRTRSRYIGKRPKKADVPTPEPDADKPNDIKIPRYRPEWSDIFTSRKASLELAWEILGLDPSTPPLGLLRWFREKARECHPDRGGDDVTLTFIIAAFSYIKNSRS